MIVSLVIILVVFFLHYSFPIIRVCGDSMYPTYLDSEVILGTKLYKKSNLKIGDVILYRSPTETDRIVIKRIENILTNHGELYFYCLGDNRDNSYDSRQYGYVSSKNLVCKVVNQRRNFT